MKLKSYKICLFLILIAAVTSCAAQKVSTIVGGGYDKNKDQTDHFVLPYGSVTLPGKWDKMHYNSVSTQQFFINKDSIRIAIAFGASNKYEFNENGALTGFDFVKAFYEWDSKYMVDTYGLSRNLVEQDSANHFIISRIFGKMHNTAFDTYFLVGEKNGYVSNFSITITNKWTAQVKIDFLKTLFLNKKQA